MSTIKPWLTYWVHMICLTCQVCKRSHRCGGGGREGRITDGVEIGKFRAGRGEIPRRGCHQVFLEKRSVREARHGFEEIRPRCGGNVSIS
jgi:hypothetical protein